MRDPDDDYEITRREVAVDILASIAVLVLAVLLITLPYFAELSYDATDIRSQDLRTLDR